MDDLIPLSLLRCGQSAEICSILGQADFVHRLSEIGLRQGVEIDIVQSGSPCILQFNGQKFCFRMDEALKIMVRIKVSL